MGRPSFLSLLVLLLAYILSGIYLLPSFQYQIDSDGVAILSVAYAIKSGDLVNSINAYWGILSPLLETPFLFLSNLQPILQIKLNQLFIGLIGYSAFFLLTSKFLLDRWIKAMLLVVAIPIFLFFAFSSNASDLLIVSLMLFYLNFLFDDRFLKEKKYSLLCGLFAGLLVLCKEYFFYYFVLHFSAISWLRALSLKGKIKSKLLAKNYLIGVAVFLLISISWGLVLSLKYQSFMLGSRGAVNVKIFNPMGEDYPMFTQGLLPSPNPHGFSAWDEPTLLKMSSWSPFDSRDNLLFELRTILKNTKVLVSIYNSYSTAYIPLIFTLALYLFIRRDFLVKRDRILLYSFLTILTFPLGYLTLSIEGRYIWINYLLGLLLGSFLLSKISSWKNKYIFMSALILFFAFYIKPSVDFLRHYRNIDHTFYDQSKFLKEKFNLVDSKVAANKNWHQTLYLSVYNHNRFYGLTKQTKEYRQVVDELEKYGVDYYFIWEEEPYLPDFQKNFKELQQREVQNLHLFSLR